MSATPVGELLFGEKDATPMSTDEATVKPWSQGRACLESAPKVWLSTARPDGRPHVMPVLVVWVDDTPYFATRPTSRKGRNLAHDPHCVLTVSSDELDLVVEGIAVRAADEAVLHRVAEAFLEKYEWEFTIRDGIARDRSLPCAPEYSFHRVIPARAFGYGPDGLTATRWRFT